ncbi:N-6 DNA methylase [Rhizobium leguminosarum]|uniref:N-6 DNA methylase n=1 Tax=Rhizobium leguminosarum TaxID=384 RepID=UPI001C92AB3D|nr:N-6 DNA methylase [Rhizobium leguminosarum]MBY2915351.1 N-6 DNA methylase [Rhizobium leguminosarum]MBY2970889.1 N-6 DNA methylase [Rhizobium leguminosarum]MBY2977956.1 N-6 DNA methylase [Rhizobium leguminosarum]MBY3006506.1 N-6 DNA methylase [Rhizobium leguminosarum]
MNAVKTFIQAAHRVGYRSEAVISDYAFADVLAENNTTRTVPLVAFTRTPPSYRSAALAVVEAQGRQAVDLVNEYRALGAPLLFVIEKDDVTVWQVRSDAPPRAIEKVLLADVGSLFERNQAQWHPDAIHRAKSIGTPSGGYQLDFVDLGLLPAIEGEIHTKLDRLLIETLNLAREAPSGNKIDPRTMFRVVFRLLAAKVLQDRRHPFSDSWDPHDLATVLAGIERYYSLGQIVGQGSVDLAQVFDKAWQHLLAGISFSNISADDLAFVYENTFVTPETRKLFGTHSTPRQVAEYVVQRLELHRHDPADLHIYEPFAGAGVFLVSALRHLRDLLPVEWSDQERHEFLIKHISGDEIDPFACEVATLSLILADYPNHNGWHIKEADLFGEGVLAQRVGSNNVIVCNPPFEAFTQSDKDRYPLAKQTHSKAIAALSVALDAKPVALGFVLPQSFILERQFAEQRRRLEGLYGTVEILKLPDGIFGASDVESSAVIARDLREPSNEVITLRSAEVAERDRLSFLKSGQTTVTRELTRSVAENRAGELWIPPLTNVWRYLDTYPSLGSKLGPRWGIRWNYDQNVAASDSQLPTHRLGYLNARRFQQYTGTQPVWLDFEVKNLREGFDQDWTKPKLIMNATRLRRGAWPLGAVVDLQGLLYSQQFFGLWPKVAVTESDLLALAAILNGPVANAYLAINSPKDRFRSSVVARIPIPQSLPQKLGELTSQYLSALRDQAAPRNNSELMWLLAELDAAVVEAYDLPLRLERQLLSFFKASERPVAHEWKHWDTLYPVPGLSLAERVSGRFNASDDWVGKVFRPLPDAEIAFFRDHVA